MKIAVNPRFCRKCVEKKAKFNKKFKHDSEIKILMDDDKGLATCIHSVQKFLSDACSSLIYSETSPSFLTLVQEATHPDVRVGIGLISALSIENAPVEDIGKPVYHYWLGSETLWEKHVEFMNSSIPTPPDKEHPDWPAIKMRIEQGVPLGERVFGLQKATGALLARASSDAFNRNCPSVIAWCPSGEIAPGPLTFPNDKFRLNNPWALVNTSDFPFLYYKIQNDDHALGFFQVQLLNIPKSLEDQKYEGRDKSWLHIFDPNRDWVKKISFAAYTLCYYFLTQICEYTLWLRNRDSKLCEQNYYFPKEILSCVGVAESDQPRNLYAASKWISVIDEIHTCLHEGIHTPSELAGVVVESLWSRDSILHHFSFGKRSQAEQILFWNEKYREHLVHILKVFLLGERIIQLICSATGTASEQIITGFKKDFKRVNGRELFEHLWMRAATIHDYSMPFERLPQLQESYWRTFLGRKIAGAGFEEPPVMQMQFGLTLSNFLLRDHMIANLLQIMHWAHFPTGDDLNKFFEDMRLRMRQQDIMYPDYVRYFHGKGDHGVASALWFLGNALIDDDGNFKNFLANSSDFSDAIDVAHACYFHNLAMARKTGTEETKLYFGSGLSFDFKDTPLTFLLLLCDVLQDEGRPATESPTKQKEAVVSDRPIGHIYDISIDKNAIKILISYQWIRNQAGQRKPERIPVKSPECKKLNWIQCKWRRKDPRAANFDCAEATCDECSNIRDTLENLRIRLKGLPVIIDVKDLGTFKIEGTL